MLIYVDHITERLLYTFDFIFKDRGVDFELTNDWLYFEKANNPKWVYSERYGDGLLQIVPSSLLFDEDLFTYSIEKNIFYKEECLSFNSIADPFASIFYILTRYEEYGAKNKDEHDRFSAAQSILFRFNWLQRVMCDRWAMDIIAFLSDKFKRDLKPWFIPCKIVPTFDIDNTYAFKWKDGWRKWLSYARDYLKKDKLRIEARKAFMKGEILDPYDSFDEIKSLAERGFDTHIFWLLGEYARFDKNISSADVRHQSLIREMAHFAKIGLHPSYRSNQSSIYLESEKKQLQHILGREVKISRQHFLKLEFPSTYKTLIEMGFEEDFTMGYAEEPGFRAGTARAFLFFDLSKNRPTNLLIHPFAYMDNTYHDYKKTEPEVAKLSIRNLYEEVSKFGGDFMFIWHNHNITEFGDWKGWKEVYEFTLNLKKE